MGWTASLKVRMPKYKAMMPAEVLVVIQPRVSLAEMQERMSSAPQMELRNASRMETTFMP